MPIGKYIFLVQLVQSVGIKALAHLFKQQFFQRRLVARHKNILQLQHFSGGNVDVSHQRLVYSMRSTAVSIYLGRVNNNVLSPVSRVGFHLIFIIIGAAVLPILPIKCGIIGGIVVQHTFHKRVYRLFHAKLLVGKSQIIGHQDASMQQCVVYFVRVIAFGVLQVKAYSA